MYKMVIQAVLFSAMALSFIVFKSDGLRQASQTGDFSQLSGASSLSSLDILGGSASSSLLSGNPSVSGAADAPWYVKFDPRTLWKNRPKLAELKPKTYKAPDVNPEGDLAAVLQAKGLDPSAVSVVKLK